MSREELLIQVIAQAVRNGWNPDSYRGKRVTFTHPSTLDVELNSPIFSHDFARAFFGNEPYFMGEVKRQHPGPGEDRYLLSVIAGPAWQFHLMMLAITEDRLAYLSKFLP